MWNIKLQSQKVPITGTPEYKGIQFDKIGKGSGSNLPRECKDRSKLVLHRKRKRAKHSSGSRPQPFEVLRFRDYPHRTPLHKIKKLVPILAEETNFLFSQPLSNNDNAGRIVYLTNIQPPKDYPSIIA